MHRPSEIARATVWGGQTLMLGLAMAVGFAVVAPPMMPLLFGARFAQPALLVGLIGVLQTSRFLLNWPSTAALAMVRSTTVLYSNFAYVVIFPAAFLGIRLIGGITGVVTGFIGGEMIAIVVALVLLNRTMHRPTWHGFDCLPALLLTGGAIVAWNLALASGSWPAMGAMLLPSVALLAWLWRREAGVIDEALAGAEKSFERAHSILRRVAAR